MGIAFESARRCVSFFLSRLLPGRVLPGSTMPTTFTIISTVVSFYKRAKMHTYAQGCSVLSERASLQLTQAEKRANEGDRPRRRAQTRKLVRKADRVCHATDPKHHNAGNVRREGPPTSACHQR